MKIAFASQSVAKQRINIKKRIELLLNASLSNQATDPKDRINHHHARFRNDTRRGIKTDDTKTEHDLDASPAAADDRRRQEVGAPEPVARRWKLYSCRTTAWQPMATIRQRIKRIFTKGKKGYFFIRLLAISPPSPNNVPMTIMLGSGTTGADGSTLATRKPMTLIS